jgi:acetyltransferase-like isoleucine patch superfamily enzyme
MITSGVTVGQGCVIGANAVVTRDLPAWSIAVGVPARVIKYRMPPLSTSKALPLNEKEH